jgi:hypothetical protein
MKMVKYVLVCHHGEEIEIEAKSPLEALTKYEGFAAVPDPIDGSLSMIYLVIEVNSGKTWQYRPHYPGRIREHWLYPLE